MPKGRSGHPPQHRRMPDVPASRRRTRLGIQSPLKVEKSKKHRHAAAHSIIASRGDRVSLPFRSYGAEDRESDREASAGARWRGLFCSLEDILHPWHGVYSRVPQATPDLAISHRSEVRFNRAVRQVTLTQISLLPESPSLHRKE